MEQQKPLILLVMKEIEIWTVEFQQCFYGGEEQLCYIKSTLLQCFEAYISELRESIGGPDELIINMHR